MDQETALCMSWIVIAALWGVGHGWKIGQQRLNVALETIEMLQMQLQHERLNAFEIDLSSRAINLSVQEPDNAD